MSNSNSFLVGLEVGTSKTCVVVGEVTETGALNIIGVGQAASNGVRKGEISDFDAATQDIRNAIVDAEQKTDMEIETVHLGVTGSHIQGNNYRGHHPVASADRELTEEDVQEALKNAKALNLPPETSVVHVVRQHFSVDGQPGIQNPVGMIGAKLEVDIHVIHGHYNRLQNAVRAVKELHLDVEEIYFNGLASSLAVLAAEERELGAAVIDIGAGTTDYVAYVGGIIKHSGVLALGGDHVTNDLAVGLKLSQRRTEQLKKSHGGAILTEEGESGMISIPSEAGLEPRNISAMRLKQIMSLRLEEILELVADDLANADVMDFLGAGIVLTGGTALTPGIEKLAANVFGLPVRIGRADSANGAKSLLDQPDFSTAIGLVRCGSFQARKKTRRLAIPEMVRSTFGNFFKRS